MEIETERLFLTEFTWNDLEEFHNFSSLPEIRRYSTIGVPNDLSETKERLKSLIEEQSAVPRKSYGWKVILKENDEFLGMAGLILSLDKFKLGEIYYEVHPSYWGKGYATEMARILIKVGFEEFHLHKVEAGVATENAPSIKVLEKTGMKREGLRRKILPIRGEWKDNFHYAIVENDPRN
ncbi:MAG: GNAT family N-acetyltransferase [Bacteroidales bacterium]